jgi:hypothetical protein
MAAFMPHQFTMGSVFSQSMDMLRKKFLEVPRRGAAG